MKKCHFSILYNELPFLKQKINFLYKNFDQLIFYDLNVCTDKPHFSTDGSHEFLKEYPDPEEKITVIEKTDLSNVSIYKGDGSIEKRKMFSIGSSYVRDEIDSFWCFDLDEFFSETLLTKVDSIFSKNESINSINLEHLIFWKNYNTILVDPVSETWKFYSRIARHRPGNIYGHCNISQDYKNSYDIDKTDELCYHYAWIGNNRVLSKIKHYTTPPTGDLHNKPMYEEWLTKVWNPYNTYQAKISDEIFGFPFMHPNFFNIKKGIKNFKGKHPNYIFLEQMQKELEQ